MKLITELTWSIRQGYIKALLSYGVNPKILQKALPNLTNDQMADTIKMLINLGVKPTQ